MTKAKRQAGKVEVVPVSWLDAQTFAEVSSETNKGNVQVFVSSDVDTSTGSFKSRIQRLVGNIAKCESIGDNEPELALEVA